MVKRVLRGPLPRSERLVGELLDATKPYEPAFWVEGDLTAVSADSRLFGPVPRSRIQGRIVWRYWPLSRAGRIR